MPVVWRFSIAQGKNHCSLQSIDRLTRCRRKTTTTTPLKVFQWKQNLINPSVQHKTFHRSVLQWTKRKTRKNRTWLLTHLPSCGHHVWNSPRHSSSPINPKLKLQALGNKEKEGKLFCSCCFFCSWSESPQGLPISYQKLTKKTISAACGIQIILQNNRWVRACLFVQHPKRFVDNPWAHLRHLRPCPRRPRRSTESTSAATRAQEDLCSWYRFSEKLSEARFARSSCW